MLTSYAHKAVQTDDSTNLELEFDDAKLDVCAGSSSFDKEFPESPQRASSSYLCYNRPPRDINKGKRVVSLPDVISTGDDALSLPFVDGPSLRIVSLPRFIRQLPQSPSLEYAEISAEIASHLSLQTDPTHIDTYNLPQSNILVTPPPPPSPASVIIVDSSRHVFQSAQDSDDSFRSGNVAGEYEQSTDHDCYRYDNWANSPPRPIPALHGPLSLPYARCPSGAEGIIIENTDLPRIIWGLDINGQQSSVVQHLPKSRPSIPKISNKAQAIIRAPNPNNILSNYTDRSVQDSSRTQTLTYMTNCGEPEPTMQFRGPVPAKKEGFGVDCHNNRFVPHNLRPNVSLHTPTIESYMGGSQVTSGFLPPTVDVSNDYIIEQRQTAAPLPTPIIWPLTVSPLVSPNLDSGFFNTQGVAANKYSIRRLPSLSHGFDKVGYVNIEAESFVGPHHHHHHHHHDAGLSNLGSTFDADILRSPCSHYRHLIQAPSPIDYSPGSEKSIVTKNLPMLSSKQTLASSGQQLEMYAAHRHFKTVMEQQSNGPLKSDIRVSNTRLTSSRLRPDAGPELGSGSVDTPEMLPNQHGGTNESRQLRKQTKPDGKLFSNTRKRNEGMQRGQEKMNGEGDMSKAALRTNSKKVMPRRGRRKILGSGDS